MQADRHLFVLNPAAGGGRGLAAARRVEAMARAEGIQTETILTQAPGHATEVARQHADSVGVVVAVGGDGTVHEVVNGLAEAALAAGGPD